jgi:hypothetical protein
MSGLGIIIASSVVKGSSMIVSVPIPSSAQIAQTDPNKVAITFDQALLDTSVPATAAFALAGKTISDVAIVGAVVSLTVTVPYNYGDIVTVDYTKPGTNQLRALAGTGQVASFSGFAVTNNGGSFFNDTSKVGWYDQQILSTITKDGSDLISQINDVLGGANNLVPLNAGLKPLYTAGGIQFAGISNLQCSVAGLAQPISMYLVIKMNSWALNDIMISDPVSGARIYFYQNDVTPKVRLYANGGGTLGPTPMAIGSYHFVGARFAGANSTLQIDDAAELSGVDIGAASPAGYVIGSDFGGAGLADIDLQCAIFRNANDDAVFYAKAKAYVQNKYGL